MASVSGFWRPDGCGEHGLVYFPGHVFRFYSSLCHGEKIQIRPLVLHNGHYNPESFLIDSVWSMVIHRFAYLKHIDGQVNPLVHFSLLDGQYTLF